MQGLRTRRIVETTAETGRWHRWHCSARMNPCLRDAEQQNRGRYPPMHTFFKSWRRKAGAVTLVMALALMIAHYRSFAVCDSLRGGFLLQRHEIASIRGTIAWVYVPRKTTAPAYCDSRHRPLICSDIWRPIEELLVLSYSEEAVIRKVPHATLAVVLAILSAFLTLWKPPQRSSLN